MEQESPGQCDSTSRWRAAPPSGRARKKDQPFARGCLGRHHPAGLGFSTGISSEAKRRGKGIGGNGNRVYKAQVGKSMAVWDL